MYSINVDLFNGYNSVSVEITATENFAVATGAEMIKNLHVESM